MKIGVYDSGIGGLTVLTELRRVMAEADFIYYADMANLPYGDKTPEEIHRFSAHMIHWMHTIHRVDYVVAACHTSSSLCVEALRSDSPIPLYGMLQPTAESVMEDTKRHASVAILATEASIRSSMHERALRKAGYLGNLTNIACPALVPLIESGILTGAAVTSALHALLDTALPSHVTTLLYGCTHYPLLQPVFEQLWPRLHHLDPAIQMARHLLQTKPPQAASYSSPTGSVTLYTSGDPALLQKNMALVFPQWDDWRMGVDIPEKTPYVA